MASARLRLGFTLFGCKFHAVKNVELPFEDIEIDSSVPKYFWLLNIQVKLNLRVMVCG